MIAVRPSGAVVVLGPESSTGFTRSMLRSTLRVSIAFTSLSVGQWLVGQRDLREIAFRAATGALLTEVGAATLRAIEPPPNAPEPLDLALTFSYGARGAELLERALRQSGARLVPLANTPVPR